MAVTTRNHAVTTLVWDVWHCGAGQSGGCAHESDEGVRRGAYGIHDDVIDVKEVIDGDIATNRCNNEVPCASMRNTKALLTRRSTSPTSLMQPHQCWRLGNRKSWYFSKSVCCSAVICWRLTFDNYFRDALYLCCGIFLVVVLKITTYYMGHSWMHLLYLYQTSLCISHVLGVQTHDYAGSHLGIDRKRGA